VRKLFPAPAEADVMRSKQTTTGCYVPCITDNQHGAFAFE
jgi:hypothetical protein